MRPDSNVFEYGAGGSTLWLAARVGSVTSVEHDGAWLSRTDREILRAGLENCTLLLREPQLWPLSASGLPDDQRDYGSAMMPGSFEEYVRAIDAFDDESFDLVLVDGRSRSACLRHAARKIRVGGLLALDDSEREVYRESVEGFAVWPNRSFEGLRPGSLDRSRTTFWQRTTVAA